MRPIPRNPPSPAAIMHSLFSDHQMQARLKTYGSSRHLKLVMRNANSDHGRLGGCGKFGPTFLLW